jgi:hypothetical protein
VLKSTNLIVFEGDLMLDRMEFGAGPKAVIPVHFEVEL